MDYGCWYRQYMIDKLGYVEFVINSLVNASTSKAPFELVYGTNAGTMVDQLDGANHVENT